MELSGGGTKKRPDWVFKVEFDVVGTREWKREISEAKRVKNNEVFSKRVETERFAECCD